MTIRTVRWFMGLALLFAMASAIAGTEAIRRQIESSMLVTGHVTIEPDGQASHLEIDQSEKIPPFVRALMERARASWRFEPVLADGVASRVTSRMSVRVVARKMESGDYQVMLRSAYFGADAIDGRERIDTFGTATVRGRKLQPPSYPDTAIEMHAKGTVYLLVQVGPDGKPMDAIAEQTNLQVVGRSEGEMRFMRNLLAKAALAASRRWLFDVPTTGELADDPYWLVRVPLVFIRVGDRQPGYGEWEAYIPGPKQRAPWAEDDGRGDADAMLAGGIYPIGQELRLLTPLQPG